MSNGTSSALVGALEDRRTRCGLTGRDIAELRWVAERLSDFYEPDEARLWLQSAHPQLDGARPYDFIVRGRTAEVLEVIERLESGVYL